MKNDKLDAEVLNPRLDTGEYTVTQLNRRVASDDPKGFLSSLIKHIKETHCGVDCSQAKPVW